ncbi:hypothetical protein KVR01_011999 [Diaporthe batatas]|uniref:uncharacterized protein n=1 Tax=Diaporthe batatas TaxID=748121 RepID=UPI001D057E33|nr:uncharacterized protein KVR01_011999 [Diaporthe batatas]KAG8158238.1 hypothetical protein KVR01_011999 [Diaporthe batatas]
MKEPAMQRVCVIGAGISGLRAAGLLALEDFEVTILEARGRVGGRVYQSSQLGPAVDMGASWIHGTQGNPFVELAALSGTATIACGAVGSIFDAEGSLLEKQHAKKFYERVWEILNEASEHSKTHYPGVPPEASLKMFVSTKLEHCPQKSLLESIIEMWGAFMGADYETQSLKSLWLDEGVDGDNLFVASTFKKIVEQVAEIAISRADLRLNAEVIRIELNEGLEKRGRKHRLEVVTRDGQMQGFDQVIVTAPLGWLQRNQHVFNPELPPRLCQAINATGYGNLEKIFIRFPKAFWDGVGQAAGQGSFPIESLFLKPKYAPKTNPHQWRQEIISFSGLPEPHAKPVIMFFTYGEWGRQISNLIKGKDHESPEFYEILDSHFRPYYSRLPNFCAESPDCKPMKFLATDWQNDEFAGYGSFTNFPLGQEDGAKDLEVLREGLGTERGVWFAGEHVAPTKGIGTVMGAYQSGEYVAKAIIKMIPVETLPRRSSNEGTVRKTM